MKPLIFLVKFTSLLETGRNIIISPSISPKYKFNLLDEITCLPVLNINWRKCVLHIDVHILGRCTRKNKLQKKIFKLNVQ